MLFNALGGALWVLVRTMAGFYLGVHGADMAALVRRLGFLGAIFALIALIVIVSYLYGRRIYARLRRGAASKTKDSQWSAGQRPEK